ncbi:conserved hypothetical protein [Thermotomaculum hydrothermale]|uniref:TIGR01777 family protein n=1 Tax=Thermotomaculum hydrothermale TaxID=981385 RepID=A0A7R6PP35_9BACT|nr:TIGR01777 family oxidoreductase [Thermotomaculum hydrothermale]BBB33607.1 conserved hypothetical protein [Thermotomaculum hydrothermale]
MKRIAITGSTGFVASYLIPFLKEKGYEIIPVVRGDFEDLNKLKEKLEKADIVVNLAGAPIVKRWSKRYKKELYSSRVDLTKKIVETLNDLNKFPECSISASAVGVYPDFKECTENCTDLREDFLGKLCNDWEGEAFKLKGKSRVVVLRIGVVIGKNGGIIKKVSIPFKLGLGGKLGSGKQGFSWIHIEDLINVILFAIENKKVEGVVNAVSPEPVNNIEFTKTLSRVLKKLAIFPVPAFALRLLFGEGAGILLEGQRVIPEKLINYGFEFKFPDLELALKQVFS